MRRLLDQQAAGLCCPQPLHARQQCTQDGQGAPRGAGPPVSAFQKRIRNGAAVLTDHICKEMNELNLERCSCIPKNVPGADWRVLLEIVAADPSRETFKERTPCPTLRCQATSPVHGLMHAAQPASKCVT